MEAVPSPCIKACRLDPNGRWCTGCGRLLEEIGLWAEADNAEKHAVLSGARKRMAGLR